jgi:hypothetical protein
MDIYYKILYKDAKEKIINTIANRDNKRIFRFNDLKSYFEQISEFSSKNNIPIFDIIKEINSTDNNNIYIQRLRELGVKKKFNWESIEGRYYFDFVLEKARKNISNKTGAVLPNRFESNFFFETVDDCFRYMDDKSPGVVAKIEIIDCNLLFKADNKLLNYFPNSYTFDDLVNHSNKLWNGESTDEPLYEIIFQGKYRQIPIL